MGALFKLLEQPAGYFAYWCSASFARPVYRNLLFVALDVRLEIGGRIYELSSSNAPGNDGLRSRGLAFAPAGHSARAAMSLEQQILLPNAGGAVAISWRL